MSSPGLFSLAFLEGQILKVISLSLPSASLSCSHLLHLVALPIPSLMPSHQRVMLGDSAFGFSGGPFPGSVVLDSSRCLKGKILLQPQALEAPAQPQTLGDTWQAPTLPSLQLQDRAC